jgi:hypothetical protein
MGAPADMTAALTPIPRGQGRFFLRASLSFLRASPLPAPSLPIIPRLPRSLLCPFAVATTASRICARLPTIGVSVFARMVDGAFPRRGAALARLPGTPSFFSSRIQPGNETGGRRRTRRKP